MNTIDDVIDALQHMVDSATFLKQMGAGDELNMLIEDLPEMIQLLTNEGDNYATT